jgi:hypothetical protein
MPLSIRFQLARFERLFWQEMQVWRLVCVLLQGKCTSIKLVLMLRRPVRSRVLTTFQSKYIEIAVYKNKTAPFTLESCTFSLSPGVLDKQQLLEIFSAALDNCDSINIKPMFITHKDAQYVLDHANVFSTSWCQVTVGQWALDFADIQLRFSLFPLDDQCHARRASTRRTCAVQMH